MFHQNHENIAEAPEQNILEGNPAQQRHKTKDTPDILRVFDVTEGKLCHPRDLLSEPNAVVGTRLTEQLVHPEGKSNTSAAGQQNDNAFLFFFFVCVCVTCNGIRSFK